MARNNRKYKRQQEEGARPDDDDVRQTPFYWDDQRIAPFYSTLSDNIDNRARIFNVSRDQVIIPDNGDGQQSQYETNRDIQELYQKPNGAYKSYTGSTKKHHKGDYVPVPKNDLNIMDYAKYMHFSYKLIRGEKSIEYRLRWGPKKTKGGDFDSTYVALHPQPYYDDDGNHVLRKDKNGNVMKDAHGKPREVRVIGKGAFVRFSKADLGQGNAGDSLIRFIQQVNGYTSQTNAYAELAHMIDDYGSETRFDPMDPDVQTAPDTAYDEEYKPMGEKHAYNLDPDAPEPLTNPYNMANNKAEDNIKSDMNGAHKYLTERIGLTDEQIQKRHIGYFPPQDHSEGNQLERAFKKQKLYGMGINSQLTETDEQGNMFDRMSGCFTQPLMRNGHVIGLKGFNKNGKKVQDVHNPRALSYGNSYGDPSAFGYNKNSPNDSFKDAGKDQRFNEFHPKNSTKQHQKAKKYVEGYLSGKRGLSKDLVDSLIDQDLIRVGYGHRRNPEQARKLEKSEEGFHDTWENKDFYTKSEFNKRNVKYVSKATSDRLIREANGYPGYIEFAQKLGDKNTRNMTPVHQRTVGADRLNFYPNNLKGYEPDKRENERGETVAGNSMHNYGFNISYGKKSSGNNRKLYVFEDPVDLLSYMDTHRKELNASHEPCDLLSLGGSSSRTKTIDNYMHHKVDDTNQRYSQITFGTHNDTKGRDTVMQYTEKARLQMPKERVNKLFQVATPPKGRSWNDTVRYLRQGNRDYSSVASDHEKRNMSDFSDKIIHDNLQGMSTSSIKDIYNIAKYNNKAYTDYINNGSRPDMKLDPNAVNMVKKTQKHLKKVDEANGTNDHYVFYNLFRNEGSSLSPLEVKNSIERLVKNSDNISPNVFQGPSVKTSTIKQTTNANLKNAPKWHSNPNSQSNTEKSAQHGTATDDKRNKKQLVRKGQKGPFNHLQNTSKSQVKKHLSQLVNDSTQLGDHQSLDDVAKEREQEKIAAMKKKNKEQQNHKNNPHPKNNNDLNF